MTHKVNIEIMVDTNANSRKLDGEYDSLREMAEQQAVGQDRAIREFRDYLRQARRRGVEYEVTQRDTAQIFHEKTNLMTPELAAQAGIEIRPDFVRENLEQGHYRVEPPIHGEEAYYDALQTFLGRILPAKAPEDVEKLEAITPENRGLVLQELFREHMMGLSGKYRNGKYRKDFDAYREVRFNAGEVTAINFLRSYPHPPEGERTAFVFVGSDQWANEEMAKARRGMRKEDEGKLEVFVVKPEQFRGLIEQVIRDIEREHPEMRAVRRSSFRELAYIDGDIAPPPHEGAEMRRPDLQHAVARTTSPRKQEASVEAQAFSSFVTRLEGEGRDSSRSR